MRRCKHGVCLCGSARTHPPAAPRHITRPGNPEPQILHSLFLCPSIPCCTRLPTCRCGHAGSRLGSSSSMSKLSWSCNCPGGCRAQAAAGRKAQRSSNGEASGQKGRSRRRPSNSRLAFTAAQHPMHCGGGSSSAAQHSSLLIHSTGASLCERAQAGQAGHQAGIRSALPSGLRCPVEACTVAAWPYCLALLPRPATWPCCLALLPGPAASHPTRPYLERV